MNANKICPLMSIAGRREVDCYCQRCVWYYSGRCAVVELAVNTGDIQGIADMLDMKGGIQE